MTALLALLLAVLSLVGGRSQAVVARDGLRDAAENRRLGNASPVVEFGVSLNIPAGGVPDSDIGTASWALRGSATWYDAPSSRDAAAGPLLREQLGKGWRGSWVRVTLWGKQREARSVTVKLTDSCLCSHGRRLIDLDDRAFARLAPLSRGVLGVTVVPVNVPAELPRTDTE